MDIVTLKKRIREYLRKLRRNLYLSKGRVRLNISVNTRGRIPALVLNVRYKKIIKYISRSILILSILLSFVALPQPLSTLVSLLLIFFEQVVERVIYSLVYFVIVPFPEPIIWEKAKFSAIITMFEPTKTLPSVIGMYFLGLEEAKRVFEYIRVWNYGKDEDLVENNIEVSFVIDEKKDRYAFFLYPSINRKSLEEITKKVKASSVNNEDTIISGQMVICKLFNYQHSGFYHFAQHHSTDDRYYLRAYSGEASSPVEISKSILKNKVKIIHRENLSDKDFEKFMCDYSIDWDDEEKVPPSMFFVDKYKKDNAT